jgi:acetoin utilization protein AcuB
MFIRDIMTKDVISVPGNTSLMDAKSIITENKIRRLPIVDNGKLIGIVTKNRLGIYMNSLSTSVDHPANNQPMTKEVKEIMETDLVIVNPDMVIEEAVALAQEKKVGALLVVENDQLVGIVTTNDFFYKIANPVLGIGENGTRLEVIGKGNQPLMVDAVTIVNEEGIRIINLHVINMPKSTRGQKDLVIHLDTLDVSKIEEALRAKGYQTFIRSSKENQ